MSDFYDMALSAIEDVPNRDKPVVLPALLTEAMNLNPRVRENTSAKTDAEILVEWSNLAQGHNKLSRQREIRRFAKWLIEKNLFLSEIRTSDIVEYLEVLRNPPPSWIGRGGKFMVDGKQNPKWRPLRSQGLSSGSLSQSRTLLSGLFEYLTLVGWTTANFVKRTAKPKGTDVTTVESKVISSECIAYLHERFFEEWTPLNNEELERKHRARMILAALYMNGIRREELCKIRMCDIKPHEGSWAISVCGKGGERNLIAAPPKFISQLVEYRRFFGLSPDYPVRESLEPLIFKLVGGFGPLTPHGLYKEIKFITKKAAESCYDPVVAAELKQISTHWYRHTHATELIRKGVSLRLVQQRLRHKDPKTTSIYANAQFVDEAAAISSLYKS